MSHLIRSIASTGTDAAQRAAIPLPVLPLTATTTAAVPATLACPSLYYRDVASGTCGFSVPDIIRPNVQ